MKVVYTSDHIEIIHHEDSQILEQIVHQKVDDEGLFKRSLLSFLEQMEACKPCRTLWDLRHLEFVISPSLETWIDENINAREVAFGIEREAFLVSEVPAAEASVEETMESKYGGQLNTAYFNSRDQALEWLTQ